MFLMPGKNSGKEGVKHDNHQDVLFQLSMFEQQIQQMHQQMQAVERGIIELKSLNLDLSDLLGKKDSEIFASVGKGIFARAKLLSEELVVDVGGKRFVSKSIPETQSLVLNQVKKLEDVKKEINDNIESLGKEARKIVQGFSEDKENKG